jgi:regulatory protein
MSDQPETANVKVNDLRIYAMRLLARREYAVKELHGRLCTKWRGEQDISQLADELVDDLVNEGSLSDERYVASFVRSRLQRSQGPVKIRAELRQRQLADSLIEQALDQGTEAWVELAAAWLGRQHSGKLEFEDRARFYRRLVNRGFSHEQAMSALDR